MKRLFNIFLAFVFACGLMVAPISVQPALAAGTIYVSVTGNDSSGAGTEGNPYRTIQKAINVADQGDTIKVTAGTYQENIVLKNDYKVIIQGDGASTTTIDGRSLGTVIYANGVASGTLIDGFTITNGNTSLGGGGIYITSCQPTTISNCIITSNSGAVAGGGLLIDTNSRATIVNCVITNNSAQMGGGIGVDSTSSTTFINCTIADNGADYFGGGIYSVSSITTITNSIIYANTATVSGPNIFGGTTWSITYSCVESGFSGPTVISGNPSFVGPGNYRLLSGSPCIDTGDPAFSGPPDLDLDGNSRIANGIVDMGAYEYGSSPPSLEYTLTTNVIGSGSVTKNPDQATYTQDSTVQVTAAPATGWSFSGWSGDLSGSTNPATVTMDGNKTITATFTENEGLSYGDIVVADDHGALNPGSPQGPARIIKVDPNTGDQTIISEGDRLDFPRAVAIDAAGDIIVLQTAPSNSVIKVDPATGTQTPISSGGYFARPEGLAIDSTGDIIVADVLAFGGTGGLIRVDPVTGAQTEIASGGSIIHTSDVTIDAVGNLYVTSKTSTTVAAPYVIIKVNPNTGTQTVIATVDITYYFAGLVIDSTGNIFVTDVYSARLIKIPADGGAETWLSSGFQDAWDLAFDAAGNLIVVDGNYTSPGLIAKVNPITGARTDISSGGLLVDPYG
ncbi:right-handed parallel beta-helix repeat-containing protein, partial [Chloroflexota bacterium]